MAFAGVDLHKSFCQAIVCTSEGEVLKEGRIPTEQEDIEEFFSGLEHLEIAFEASTNYEYFYDLLESLGHHVVVAHPLKTRIKTELRRKNIKYQAGANCFTKKGKAELRSLHNTVIDSYLTIYEVVEEELKKMDRAIEEAGTQYEAVRLLTSIKGIGVYSALVIYSEIGDGSRFPTEDHIFSYAGLTPRVHQTGNEQYYGRITKEGSKYLRWILVEAARIHVQWCPESKITRHYEKIKRKRGDKVAIVAAARKLIQAIYYMLKNNEPFRIEG
jgi:transposase